MISAFLKFASRLVRSKDGNVAMLFGILVVPMIGSIGLAIDFGQILTAKNKVQVAADAAALQAGGVALDLIGTGDGSEAATASGIAEGKRRGALLFRANASQLGVADATATIEVTRKEQQITSRVEFQVTRVNFLAFLFGQKQFAATGVAVSSQSLQTYSDVHIAVDVSQSMGIAATKDDMVRLFNARVKLKDGSTQQTSCVFGCHAAESDDHAESYSDVAARLGIRLRIDVLRDATKKLVETARTDSQSFPIYRIALYSMGMAQSYTSGALLTLHALSGNFTTLASAADQIVLGASKGNRFSDSYQNETLAELNTSLAASGDGSSQTKAKKYVILITDGVRDVQKGTGCVQTGNRCVSTLEQTSCTAMKAKGITLGVLYTTYLPPRPFIGTDFYTVQVVNTGVAPKIQTALKDCASPGWFYEASDATAIDLALDKMFKQTRAEPMLTQ